MKNININEKFIVVDEDNGDRWTEVHDTAEEANAAAQAVWQHLTEREQRSRHIWAGVVTRDDLDDDAVDEETGTIDWSAWVNANTFPGAFDSEVVANE